MHEGVLAAKSDLAALLTALEEDCGKFQLAGDVTPSEWLRLPDGEDAFHVVGKDGSSYFLDPSMVLTSNPDLAVSLSGKLACSVAVAGAETVSGTFWLAIAEGGRLRRFHWNIQSTLKQALDMGERLASETRIPVEDPDGRGLFACLEEAGFDVGVMTRPTAGGQKYAWADFKLPPAGALIQAIKDHHSQFARAGDDDWTKNIKAVARPDGGVDLRYVEPAAKGSLLKRLFRR